MLIPGLIIVLGLMVAGGRLWFARSAVAESAYSAARAASLARSPAEAAVAGPVAGRAALATDGLECAGTVVTVSTAGFAVPVGQPATITSRVQCTITFSDVLLPGMPGSLVVEATSASALDTYRSR